MSSKIENIDDTVVRYLYEVKGWTQQEIADCYGVSHGCIYWRIHPEKLKDYNQSDKRKVSSEIFRQTNKSKENKKRWRRTDKGIVVTRRANYKRRELGLIPLNEPFEYTEAHHIDEVHIIYMPKEIHQTIYHDVRTGQGMEEINTIAFQYITEETFDKLIAGEI